MYTCFVETNNNMFVFRNQTFSLNSILFAHLRDFLAQPSSTTDTQGPPGRAAAVVTRFTCTGSGTGSRVCWFVREFPRINKNNNKSINRRKFVFCKVQLAQGFLYL